MTMLRLFLILMLLLLAGTHFARAYPIREGAPLPKCLPLAQKPAAMQVAHERGTVQTFDGDSSKRLMTALNDMPPETDYTGVAVVDVVTTSDDDTFPVHMFATDDKLFCEVGVFKKAFWEKLADKAFGQGT